MCARAELDVIVVEANPAAAAKGAARLERSLRRAEERGKVDSAADVLARVRVVTDLDALADRELVVEAIVEDEAAKTELFRQLDEIVTSPDAILASNTSSIPIMKLGVVTQRPQQVMGIHFFNPVPVLNLVELVPSLMTAPETTERARAFVSGSLGKQAIDCQDRAGFVVNALLIPFVLSAIRMLESGFATAEDIDRGLVLGAAHPAGPVGARRSDRARHDEGRGGVAVRGVQGAPVRAAARCSPGWSTQACSAGSPAAASTPTRPDDE